MSSMTSCCLPSLTALFGRRNRSCSISSTLSTQSNEQTSEMAVGDFFELLPTEVSHSILNLLSASERQRLIAVCKNWRFFALSPEFWHEVKYERVAPFAAVVSLSRQLVDPLAVKVLDLRNCRNIHFLQMETVLSRCSNVTEIFLPPLGSTSDFIQELRVVVASHLHCDRLSCVHLSLESTPPNRPLPLMSVFDEDTDFDSFAALIKRLHVRLTSGSDSLQHFEEPTLRSDLGQLQHEVNCLRNRLFDTRSNSCALSDIPKAKARIDADAIMERIDGLMGPVASEADRMAIALHSGCINSCKGGEDGVSFMNATTFKKALQRKQEDIQRRKSTLGIRLFVTSLRIKELERRLYAWASLKNPDRWSTAYFHLSKKMLESTMAIVSRERETGPSWDM